MSLPTAAFEGLESVYNTIQVDGIIDVGLQAALDVGVPESGYIQVPRCVLKQVRLGKDFDGGMAGSAASKRRLASPDTIRVEK